MPIVYLAPDPVQSTFLIPGSNTPGNGVKLFCYVAGSVSTKQNMYTDNTGTTTYSNPLVMDSGGNIPNGGVIWIPQGLPAKFVWAPATDSDPPTSPYRTIDNVSGINDTTTQEWVLGPTPTFVNASTFTMAGDQTGTFKPSRRMKFAVTAGTVYGAVANALFATSTTVNAMFAAGSLDAGLTAVSYSLIDPSSTSSIGADYIHRKAPAVPSSGNGTTNIWGIDGDYVHVTGTNTIAHFSSAPYPGAERTLIFDGTLSINTSAALGLPGGNVTTAANDRAKIRAETTSTHTVTFYQRASGLALVSSTNQFTRTVLTTSSQTLTSTGTYLTPAGVVLLDIELQGGGGAGAAAATNGGTNGSSSSFSTAAFTTLIAGGGIGGTQGAGSGGAGGSASGGDINISGGSGGGGLNLGFAGNTPGGAGGNGVFGGGAGAPQANTAGSAAGANSGGGGSGGGNSGGGATGAGGGAGGYTRKRVVSPSTSYAYCVGGGGTGGAAGTNAGGNGAAGLIIITEYYNDA